MLARVDSYPYLCVTIPSDLKWHNHISHITAKASRTLGFVGCNVYNCPPEVKSLAYTSLIRPQLEYASAAWDPYLVGDIQQLEKVQRRAARFVFRDYKYTTSVTGLLGRLQPGDFSHSVVTPIAYLQHTVNTNKTCVNNALIMR